VARNETKAIIELVGGGRIEAAETPDELERRFTGGGASPLQEVKDVDGLKHWVNLSQVTEIYQPPAPG
jgi:hypothetical protein